MQGCSLKLVGKMWVLRMLGSKPSKYVYYAVLRKKDEKEKKKYGKVCATRFGYYFTFIIIHNIHISTYVHGSITALSRRAENEM